MLGKGVTGYASAVVLVSAAFSACATSAIGASCSSGTNSGTCSAENSLNQPGKQEGGQTQSMASIRKTFQMTGGHWSTQDPFMFIAYHKDNYPRGDGRGGLADKSHLRGRNIGSDFSGKDGFSMYHGETIPGFPKHPHCGFETVTIAEKGLCDHSDSLGCGGRFGDGDVQWMTAGGGVQHCEMFPLRNTTGDNLLELFQIWCNLPRKAKKVPAHYAMLWHEDIKVENVPGGTVKVIADHTMADIPQPPPNSWAADAGNFVDIKILRLDDNAVFTIPPVPSATPKDVITRTLYFFEGSQIQEAAGTTGKAYKHHTGFELDALAPFTFKVVGGPAKLLLLQGRSIQEPVAQRGPFVGNEQEDIYQAMNDYRRTGWGGWPWPSDDPIHELKKGRFAQYPDGKVEERG